MKNKALFLDLDWTLIRPKSGAGVTVCYDDENINSCLPKGKTKTFAINIGGGYVRVDYVNTFPENQDDWEFVPGILNAIEPYLEEGFMLIIVSNQGGIEAGFHSQLEVTSKLTSVIYTLEFAFDLTNDTQLRTTYYFCPTNNPQHPDRKPNAGMLAKAFLEHDLDMSLCLMVGDMESDRQCAANGGVSYMDVHEFLRTHVA